MKKELGGERLGTGAKIKVDLHGWGRSTFNQSREWRSTMGVGMGIPCFKEIGLNGTTFDIDIKTLGHTIPTIAPLFGQFKLQVDLFACPIRLYQGLLHNNAVNIGLEMNKVLIPQIEVAPNKTGRTNTSSLLNYLGIKGITDERKNFNAIPILAYYDIFKNYYSNKQEKDAKIIEHNNKEMPINTNTAIITISGEETRYALARKQSTYPNYYDFVFFNPNNPNGNTLTLNGGTFIEINSFSNTYFQNNLNFELIGTDIRGRQEKTGNYQDNKPTFKITQNDILIGEWWYVSNTCIKMGFYGNPTGVIGNYNGFRFFNNNKGIKITDFPLENIDEARKQILMLSGKEERVRLAPNGEINFLPYSANFENDSEEMAIKEMNGLFLKTYMSDIFNNFLSNSNIQLINDLSSINFETDENGYGNISMDTIIMANKIYNLLNRIAVSGGTYENWQESVYGQKVITRAESPIYIGGTSAMIQFQEVVSTAESGDQPLGSLGGRGIMGNRKGGKIIYKCNEPTIILGIASITPMIDYYQGNYWFMSEIDNMDNFHKPELDGIGFQNIIANQVHWADSETKGLAKTTAWIHYQTAVNEVFGYFAEPEDDTSYKSLGHMVLRRDFEVDTQGNITDFTTYIDPEKYNKIFAGNTLTDQNFWMQIGFNVKSRRVMAAYEIPNL